jgi:hypothetical protein
MHMGFLLPASPLPAAHAAHAANAARRQMGGYDGFIWDLAHISGSGAIYGVAVTVCDLG